MKSLTSMSESALLQFCEAELENEVKGLPMESARHLENTDEYVCTRLELLDAIRMASSPAIRQALYATYRHRLFLEMIDNPRVPEFFRTTTLTPEDLPEAIAAR